jgi:acetylornithine/succinyldiaminopimelate/putrescine aminotransferase
MDSRGETEEIIQMENRHASGAYNPAPIVVVSGDGVRLLDQEGRQYLDCGSGIGVAALGHAHPALVSAISDQAGALITCASGYYHNDVRARLLQRLTEITPGDLERVFLSNSGAEAVETAIKLARVCTQRTGIVAAMRGYHGRTLGALTATWKTSSSRCYRAYRTFPLTMSQALTRRLHRRLLRCCWSQFRARVESILLARSTFRPHESCVTNVGLC